ncbi:cytochrome c [Flavobacterium sp. Arc2]|uniref:c-type cytochrome n=1 Tax=Flavobacterium sp. Arc2 TaxID=3046685 RepID=UPI00352EB33B
MIAKLHLGIALFASAYLYYSNPSVLSKTNYHPISQIQQQTPLQKSIADGKEVYADFCMQCHQANGKGDGASFPTLDGSNWLTEKRTQSIHAIKFGLNGPIVVNGKKFKSAMPPMGLSNKEVTDVMNYIMNSWSNKQKKSVSLEEVALVKQ